MPSKITNKLMTPEAAFKKYGFAQAPDGLWKKDRGANGFDLSSEQWLKVDGGWLCFVSAERRGFGGAMPGYPITSKVITTVQNNSPVLEPADPAVLGLQQLPQGQSEDFGQVSGVNPSTHPFAYRWLWTDDEVAFIYQFAEEGWVKEQDPETGDITMTRASG